MTISHSFIDISDYDVSAMGLCWLPIFTDRNLRTLVQSFVKIVDITRLVYFLQRGLINQWIHKHKSERLFIPHFVSGALLPIRYTNNMAKIEIIPLSCWFCIIFLQIAILFKLTLNWVGHMLLIFALIYDISEYPRSMDSLYLPPNMYRGK